MFVIARRLRIAVVIAFPTTLSALPPGFVDEPVGGSWNQAVGVAFADDGRAFVWEKAGLVWNVEGGVKALAPLIDISEEVGNWRDYGLLGFAVDPDFYNNGYIYLLYVVDYHHLAFFGTGTYDPATNSYFRDTIARLVRYTCTPGDGYRSVDYASRHVLIGDAFGNGFPICNQSHGIGSLAFGDDGTLLASCGDGAGYRSVDTGTPTSGSSNTCLSDGIITQKEDVGAYRSQLLDSLNGKILRIDPATGNGIPSNPWYDISDPDSPRSRVWSLGLRNPFRFTIRPGSGDTDPAKADPGTAYIGDVGWYLWEELQVADGPGQNLGWPVFEGLGYMAVYANQDVPNQDAPNPLFNTTPPGQPICSQEFFTFEDLIIQDTLGPRSFPNPCDPTQQISGTTPTFMHTRPAADWRRGGVARVGTYSGNDADEILIGAPGSPVVGTQFEGSSSTGGVWYTGTQFPVEYQDTYFHADFTGTWIRNFVFDEFDELSEVRKFGEEGIGAIVAMAMDPIEESLYYIGYDAGGCCMLRKIVWAQNTLPIAVAQSDIAYGPAPLVVQLTGTNSSDPEGNPGELNYAWDFDTGTPISHLANPIHRFPSVDASSASDFDGMIFTLNPPQPVGGGNPDPQVMRDGDYPPVGSGESVRQFDTYHAGDQGNEDWIGYIFFGPREVYSLVFQEGKHFFDGGWFDAFTVQSLNAGIWTDVTGFSSTPPYPGNNGLNFETFEFHFDPVLADGIRIHGQPGGSNNFISVGELRVVTAPDVPVLVPTRYDVTLTVTDGRGGQDSTDLDIYINNSPPIVQIISPVDGTILCIEQNTDVDLVASIADNEHTTESLLCSWQTLLHHDVHVHPEPVDSECTSSTVLSPHDSQNAIYYWETVLTVTDPLGLSQTQSAIVTSLICDDGKHCTTQGCDDETGCQAPEWIPCCGSDFDCDGEPDGFTGFDEDMNGPDQPSDKDADDDGDCDLKDVAIVQNDYGS